MWLRPVFSEGSGGMGLRRCGGRSKLRGISELSSPVPQSGRAGFVARGASRRRGLCVLAQAQSLVETTGERWLEAELHLLKGELTLIRYPARINDALTSYRASLAIAAKQSARRWELRTAVSLAGLLRDSNETMRPGQSLFLYLINFVSRISTTSISTGRTTY